MKKIADQHRRNKEIEKALERHARNLTRENLVIGGEPEQQQPVVHEKHGHRANRHQRQQQAGEMRLHPIHYQPRLTRRGAGRSQPDFIADVVNSVEAGGCQQRLQQKGWRYYGHIKAEYQYAGQRKTKVEGQQKQQRKEEMKVKAHAPELTPGERQDKAQRAEINHQQTTELQQTHDALPSLRLSAWRQPAR